LPRRFTTIGVAAIDRMWPPAHHPESRVMLRTTLVAVVGLTLTSCGVYGVKGNDTGGIIPWSPEAEAAAQLTADANCGAFRKYGRVTSMIRRYGDYIVYECRFPREDPVGAVVSVRG
jgi:hypothetical protein